LDCFFDQQHEEGAKVVDVDVVPAGFALADDGDVVFL
jgi:hypothetical protein